MKILIKYLKPYKWLVLLTLILAAINQTFSLFDPMIFGKLIDQFANHPHSTTEGASRTQGDFINGILFYLALLVGTAMVSRIAKAFQDYFSNVIIQKFGARIFTDGLKHSMRLPYQDFEDQRSGETLGKLQKVRTDVERLMTSFINILFVSIVGIVVVSIYTLKVNWVIGAIYFSAIPMHFFLQERKLYN